MTAHELTHTIRNDMPVYPGTEQPRLTTACTIDQCGYRETLLHMFSHTGTHMDAPAHMLRDGTALDCYDAAKFAGPAVVVDCRGQRAITLSLLQSYDLNGADFVLFCTGWDKKWGTPGYYEGFPCLTAEAAAYLAGLPLKGVGRTPESKPEGFRRGGLYATALIGPLLILNPPLCKWLLRQMGAEDTLAFEDAAFASFNKRVAEFKEPGRGFQYS